MFALLAFLAAPFIDFLFLRDDYDKIKDNIHKNYERSINLHRIQRK